MASGERFYLLELTHRPAVYGDLGSILKIQGLVIGGETGGANDTSNFISACRGCNKKKGSMPPQDWCKLRGLDYQFYVDYLINRQLP